MKHGNDSGASHYGSTGNDPKNTGGTVGTIKTTGENSYDTEECAGTLRRLAVTQQCGQSVVE